MISSLRRALLVAIGPATLGMSMLLTGCPAVFAALPDVIAAITSGAQIIDAIESFVNGYFLSHPDIEAQQKVGATITRCRLALHEALTVARATKDLHDQKVDVAFEEFKQAYIELLQITQVYGVHAAPPGAMKMRAEPNQLVVPDAATAASHAKSSK